MRLLCAIQGQVEHQYVDPRLTEHAPLRRLDVCQGQAPHGALVEMSDTRDARHLVEGRRGRNVRVETTSRCRDQSASIRPLTASINAGLSGPKLDPPEAKPLLGVGEVADSRPQKYPGLWND